MNSRQMPLRFNKRLATRSEGRNGGEVVQYKGTDVTSRISR
jgi:hypothetical protein